MGLAQGRLELRIVHAAVRADHGVELDLALLAQAAGRVVHVGAHRQEHLRPGLDLPAEPGFRRRPPARRGSRPPCGSSARRAIEGHALGRAGRPPGSGGRHPRARRGRSTRRSAPATRSCTAGWTRPAAGLAPGHRRPADRLEGEERPSFWKAALRTRTAMSHSPLSRCFVLTVKLFWSARSRAARARRRRTGAAGRGRRARRSRSSEPALWQPRGQEDGNEGDGKRSFQEALLWARKDRPPGPPSGDRAHAGRHRS